MRTDIFLKVRILIDSCIDNLISTVVYKPERGLSYFFFRLAGYMLPLINIELLIYDKQEKVVMSWRQKSKDVPVAGWHLPGGIFRIGETIDQRVKRTAEIEVGAIIDSWRIIGITETILPIRISRRHFISLLVECDMKDKNLPLANDIKFFRKAPENIILNHKRYAPIIDEGRKENRKFRFIKDDIKLAEMYASEFEENDGFVERINTTL